MTPMGGQWAPKTRPKSELNLPRTHLAELLGPRWLQEPSRRPPRSLWGRFSMDFWCFWLCGGWLLASCTWLFACVSLHLTQGFMHFTFCIWLMASCIGFVAFYFCFWLFAFDFWLLAFDFLHLTFCISLVPFHTLQKTICSTAPC